MSRRHDDRAAELESLMQAIWSRETEGDRVPCVQPERGHLWLSEDRADIEAAIHRCRTCPALGDCRSYINQFPEPAGVWAAQSATERTASSKESPWESR